jgi:hypothetical protein
VLIITNQQKWGGWNMDIRDSVDVKNSVKLRSVLVAVSIYLFLTIATAGIALIALLIAAIISNIVCKKEILASSSKSNVFKKNFPFKYFGASFGDFQHVFYHKEELETEIITAINNELSLKTPVASLEPVSIKDIDNDLTSPEERKFLIADSGKTKRGTSVTLAIKLSNFGSMQSIRWWVLAGGYIDKDKKFNFIAYSPFTILFWIIPYLKKEYDVLSRLRTIYFSSYNDMDVITQIRCLHEAVFSAMVAELEKNGIDTSDIKAQRMQVMNITISGGKVNMGNVIQGAMNKMTANIGGAKL